MKKLAAIILVAGLVLNPAAALADDGRRVVTFAVDPNWPPLEFLDSGGQMVGYAIDYFTAVCRESGLEAKFVKSDWDGIFDRLDAGDYDAVMASVTVTPERRAKMDFTIPYYIVRQSLLVPANSQLANIRQLSGQKVGTQSETTATGIVEKLPGAVSQTYPNIEDAINALAAGDLDVVICEDVVASSFLSQPSYSGKIKMASVINTPGAEELYAVAVKKDNLEILVPLNDGIKAIKAKGLETELRRKWMAQAN